MPSASSSGAIPRPRATRRTAWRVATSYTPFVSTCSPISQRSKRCLHAHLERDDLRALHRRLREPQRGSRDGDRARAVAGRRDRHGARAAGGVRDSDRVGLQRGEALAQQLPQAAALGVVLAHERGERVERRRRRRRRDGHGIGGRMHRRRFGSVGDRRGRRARRDRRGSGRRGRPARQRGATGAAAAGATGATAAARQARQRPARQRAGSGGRGGRRSVALRAAVAVGRLGGRLGRGGLGASDPLLQGVDRGLEALKPRPQRVQLGHGHHPAAPLGLLERRATAQQLVEDPVLVDVDALELGQEREGLGRVGHRPQLPCGASSSAASASKSSSRSSSSRSSTSTSSVLGGGERGRLGLVFVEHLRVEVLVCKRDRVVRAALRSAARRPASPSSTGRTWRGRSSRRR